MSALKKLAEEIMAEVQSWTCPACENSPMGTAALILPLLERAREEWMLRAEIQALERAKVLQSHIGSSGREVLDAMLDGRRGTLARLRAPAPPEEKRDA